MANNQNNATDDVSSLSELTRLLPVPPPLPTKGPRQSAANRRLVEVRRDLEDEAGFLRRLCLTLCGLVVGAEVHGIGLLACTLVEGALPSWLALRPKLLVLDTITGIPSFSILAMTFLPSPKATEAYYGNGMPRVKDKTFFSTWNDDVFHATAADVSEEDDDWRPSNVWLLRFCFECGVTLAILMVTWIVGCHCSVILLKYLVCGRQRAGSFDVWRSQRGYSAAVFSVGMAASAPAKTWMAFDAWFPSQVWRLMFRALGARIGKNVTFAGGPPLGTDFHGMDLLTIGDDVTFEEKSRIEVVLLSTPNVVRIAPIVIGDKVFVGAVAEVRAGAEIDEGVVVCAGAGCDGRVEKGAYVTSAGSVTTEVPPGGYDTVVRLPHGVCDWVPLASLAMSVPFLCVAVLFPFVVVILTLMMNANAANRLRTLALCARDVACREIVRSSRRHVTYEDGRAVETVLELWGRTQLRLFESGLGKRTVFARQAACVVAATAWFEVAAPLFVVSWAFVVKRILRRRQLLGDDEIALTPAFVTSFKTIQAWAGWAVDSSSKLFLYTGLMNLVYASFGLEIAENATLSELLVSRGSLECIQVQRGAYLAANLCLLTARVDIERRVASFLKTTIAEGSFVGPLTVAAAGTTIQGATGSCAVVDGTISKGHIAVGDDGSQRLAWRPRPRDAWSAYPKAYALVSTVCLGSFSWLIHVLSLAPYLAIFYFVAPKLALRLLYSDDDSLLPRIVTIVSATDDDANGQDDDDDRNSEKDVSGVVVSAFLTVAFLLIHNLFFVALAVTVALVSGPTNALIHLVTKWLCLGHVETAEYALRSRKHLGWMLTLKAGRLGSVPAAFCFLFEYVRLVVTLLGASFGRNLLLFPHPETIQAFPEADVVQFGDDVLFSGHVYGHDFSQMHLKFKATSINSNTFAPDAWQAQVLPGTSLPHSTTLRTVGRASFFPGVANMPHRTYRGNPARVIT